MNVDKRFNELMCFAATEATLALSKLLKKQMKVEVIDVSIIKSVNKKELAQQLSSDEQEVIMTTSLVGMLEGVAAFILPTQSALKLCDFLLNRKNGSSETLDDLEQSALLEAGNIVIGNFLNALGYVSVLQDIVHKKLKIIVGSAKDRCNLGLATRDELLVRTSFHLRHSDNGGELKHVDIDGLCVFYFNKASVLAKIF